MNCEHSWLKYRCENMDKIKQRKKNYETEQKAMRECEIQIEKDRRWLYRYKRFKLFFKIKKNHSFGCGEGYPKYTTKSKQ